MAIRRQIGEYKRFHREAPNQHPVTQMEATNSSNRLVRVDLVQFGERGMMNCRPVALKILHSQHHRDKTRSIDFTVGEIDVRALHLTLHES